MFSLSIETPPPDMSFASASAFTPAVASAPYAPRPFLATSSAWSFRCCLKFFSDSPFSYLSTCSGFVLRFCEPFPISMSMLDFLIRLSQSV
ncbi:hypothetical protein TrLO_g13627 [Triparma laevis f. longispina]|uniref:Uncharacterized protein n=1 Tax=Triparma laevis f. longispina TaxID=1714387 RepID=A0A9W6ZZK0_9STRA|nr:hypothetical protein TrLO_g13627 [Triparma laevis f. longispina]